MARHNDFGKKGEAMAAEWLVQRGYRIIDRNWRHGRYEVDIIAGFGDICHFIEVKAAATPAFGHPEEKVNKRKIKNLMKSSAAWLHSHGPGKRIQYDILSITIHDHENPEFFLISDVYVH
jgi:putative endonuclease